MKGYTVKEKIIIILIIIGMPLIAWGCIYSLSHPTSIRF
jgi:hypothetical protein